MNTMREEYYIDDDYYYIGSFMNTASFTFEEDCTQYWNTTITEPLMLS